MSPQALNERLANATLQSIEHGAFPQDEEVISATVPSSTLPKLLEAVNKAREDTKNQVRKLSREAAPNVDGWIAQARRLQDDIKRSQDTAKEIVQQTEVGKADAAKVQDAANKVSFLYSEIAYTESLAQALEQLKDISALLDSAQNAAVHGHIMHALQTLEDANRAFKRLGPFESTRPVSVLRNKEEHLRKTIVETVTESWNTLVAVDSTSHHISLKQSIEGETKVEIGSVVEALTKLNLLDNFITRFSRDFDKIIVSPRLVLTADKSAHTFEIRRNEIQRNERVRDGDVDAALKDIRRMTEYLSTHLHPSIAIPMSSKLIPIIAARLISNLLLPAVPLSMEGIDQFQDTLSSVSHLANYFDGLGWFGQGRLKEWVNKSAEIWLARQKEAAIARVQTLVPKRIKEKKTVERVETQVVSKGDALHTGDNDDDKQNEEWGADWGDEDTTKGENFEKAQAPEEEDMSAWGEEEEETIGPSNDLQVEVKAADDEDAEDWGADWGDEDVIASPARPKVASQPTELPKTNGKPPSKKQQEVTLRETYKVTGIPDSIMEIIIQVTADVGTLNSPKLNNFAINSASRGLYAIPSLLLAMYRATAAVHYSRDVAGNMLIYNDCQRLSDQLRLFLQEQADKDKSSTLPRDLQASMRLKPMLDVDIKSIDGFGKRAYGREMESQRQIIRDHLEDAQGFQGCTNAPFATVCDDAIATTIDRIDDVKRQWQDVLSHGALLQSLGSLVSTALTKFLNDVEDLSDIAEDESKKLHGYCVSLATLAQQFQTEDGYGGTRDMASIYIPNWFKFQYLSEILDSTLADIKYFWTDGELKLEMEAEEVVSLIEALFAPSDHRRRAIAEIRRASMA